MGTDGGLQNAGFDTNTSFWHLVKDREYPLDLDPFITTYADFDYGTSAYHVVFDNEKA